MLMYTAMLPIKSLDDSHYLFTHKNILMTSYYSPNQFIACITHDYLQKYLQTRRAVPEL